MILIPERLTQTTAPAISIRARAAPAHGFHGNPAGGAGRTKKDRVVAAAAPAWASDALGVDAEATMYAEYEPPATRPGTETVTGTYRRASGASSNVADEKWIHPGGTVRCRPFGSRVTASRWWPRYSRC